MPVSQSLSPRARAEIAAISARHLARVEALDRRFAAMEPEHKRRAREMRNQHENVPRIRDAIDRDDAFLERMEARRRRREEVTR